ncbi:MAG: cytochrome c oxidase, cbb3-type, CcoQ subunit [Campylobacteraceae bacterium]|nr:cytochrome c oxidase, cbb3-type, CcoQ subunit [Campylobacteraceae bacterium]
METIQEFQAYGYFFFTVFLVVVLYGYIYHLYRSEKSGRRDYEKYADIALNDAIDDIPVEAFSDKLKEENGKKEQQNGVV